MASYFYIDNGGNQCGPVDESVLRSLNISPETFVWREGMPDWVQAKNVPELAYLFHSNTGFPPGYGAQSAYGPQSGYGPQYAPGAYQQPQPTLPCPPTYMVWSIIITVCCCLVGGIVAIVYSSQVEPAWRSGDYALAVKKSNQAKTWIIISAIIGLVGSCIYGGLALIGGIFN